jgi:hypothetical protein
VTAKAHSAVVAVVVVAAGMFSIKAKLTGQMGHPVPEEGRMLE